MNRRHRILAVDDDAMNRIILADYLSEDHDLTLAETGDECLRLLEEVRPDLVLLDIMMPGTDGYEVCRRIRADKRFRHTKVILVSAKALQEERLRGYEAGANDYVTKPFSGDELRAKVEVYLQLAFVEELEALKSQFLSLLFHETRTPLTSLMASSELLVPMLEEGSEGRECATTVLKTTKQLESTIHTALRICEFKAGTQDLEHEEVDFRALCEEAVAALDVDDECQSCDLTLQCEGGEYTVETDREAALTALRGLFLRSFQKSSGHSRAKLTLSLDANEVVLTASNDNEPVAEEWRPFIFEDFLVPNLLHHSSGSELDLALSACIVRSLGGRIEARFEQGVHFTVRLPRTLGSNQDSSNQESQEEPAPVG